MFPAKVSVLLYDTAWSRNLVSTRLIMVTFHFLCCPKLVVHLSSASMHHLHVQFNESRSDTFMKLFFACDGTNIEVIYILNIGSLHIAFCNVTFFGLWKVQCSWMKVLRSEGNLMHMYKHYLDYRTTLGVERQEAHIVK